MVGLGDDGFDSVALLVVDFEPASYRCVASHGSNLRLAATGWHFGWGGGGRAWRQCRHTLSNLRTALEAAGATPADVAKFNVYMVDYSWDALQALMSTTKEVFGDPYPLTASTLVGVASLWLPDLLVEIDAVAII
jgi:hypothetical protein